MKQIDSTQKHTLNKKQLLIIILIFLLIFIVGLWQKYLYTKTILLYNSDEYYQAYLTKEKIIFKSLLGEYEKKIDTLLDVSYSYHLWNIAKESKVSDKEFTKRNAQYTLSRAVGILELSKENECYDALEKMVREVALYYIDNGFDIEKEIIADYEQDKSHYFYKPLSENGDEKVYEGIKTIANIVSKEEIIGIENEKIH